MRVVTMALMDCVYYVLAIAAFTLAFIANYWHPFSYISALFMALMFILLFLSVPLKLNWSSNLYGHLLWRFLSFLIFMLLVYAICYYKVGFIRTDGARPTFLEAVYFSITSFTTVQYGEYRPLPQSRVLVSVESLMALVAFIPFFAAFGWLYCQNRLWKQSMEDKSVPNNFKITPDPVLGGWKEIENEKTKLEAIKRNKKLKGVPCARCGSQNPHTEKIYDVIGRTTPLALYVVYCHCGQITKPSTFVYLAVWRWLRLNKKFKKRKK